MDEEEAVGIGDAHSPDTNNSGALSATSQLPRETSHIGPERCVLGFLTVTDGWMTWREAWDLALYGPNGFYRTQQPADHFRTSVHASPTFADALLVLMQREGLTSVTDLGAGGGELLAQLHARDATLSLAGIEIRPRPAALPATVRWGSELPDRLDGLVLANELLDNIPCDVVELDRHGDIRFVEVHPRFHDERLGDLVDDQTASWLERWWPVSEPGQRAEVGRSREEWWVGVCSRIGSGVALVVDFGHTKGERPDAGSLASYRAGRHTPLNLDGRHDVTAHVAVDALAAAVTGSLSTQRESLRGLGVTAARPELALASTDPAAYVAGLVVAGEQAELIGSPGLGDFWWVQSRHLSSAP